MHALYTKFDNSCVNEFSENMHENYAKCVKLVESASNDRFQDLLLTLTEFVETNKILVSLKSSENLYFGNVSRSG